MAVWQNQPLCLTLEEPWNENRRRISCIPSGIYKCRKRVSQKFGHHWHVLNVPERTLILIHQGNSLKDTEGCILVGSSLITMDGKPAIGNSRRTMNMLREVLPNEFLLHVINCF